MFLPGKFHGWRSLAGYSPWGHKESNKTWATSLCVCVYIFVFVYNTNTHICIYIDILFRISVFLPGKFYGWRSLAGYSPWGHKESNKTWATSWCVCVHIFVYNINTHICIYIDILFRISVFSLIFSIWRDIILLESFSSLDMICINCLKRVKYFKFLLLHLMSQLLHRQFLLIASFSVCGPYSSGPSVLLLLKSGLSEHYIL